MEQDQLFGRHEPLNGLPGRRQILIAAHGERGGIGTNASVVSLAAEVRRLGLATEVHCGFINGEPTIAEAVRAFTEERIVVYPLFMSDGYFTRICLPKLLAEAYGPRWDDNITLVSPLGLDLRLRPVIVRRALAVAARSGIAAKDLGVVLLAHGSRQSGPSRRASEALCRSIQSTNLFANVSCAFLEEPPGLHECIANAAGPAVVVGLFVGNGLHGQQDTMRLMGEVGRAEVMFTGNVGEWPEIAEVVAAALAAPEVNSTTPA